jgi:hypothetical protein
MYERPGGGDVADSERFRGQFLPECPIELTFVLPRSPREQVVHVPGVQRFPRGGRNRSSQHVAT